ncbi:MAG: glycosyltransferase, partial [Anaerolineae bacterium]|nr:glycosyltransferase [Anaerolineae bacterium]
YYPTLGRELRRAAPEVFHIDEEPYNLSTYLALRQARAIGARALFFTWQNLPRRYPPPFRNLERYVLQHADWALVGNQAAEGVLRSKGYRGPATLIPQFGVDPEIYRPLPEADHPAVPFVVGYAGRLVAAKGLVHLLEALAGLRGDWRLEVAGSGPLGPALEARAQALGVAGRLSLCPHVPSLEMPRFYNRLDALVLPSLTMSNWREQFGRVLIEAMACGVPVVGSSSGEIPNVINDAGLIFPEGDVRALREALQRLYDSPALRAELAARGRRRVEEHYTQARIAAATVEVYHQMLGEGD